MSENYDYIWDDKFMKKKAGKETGLTDEYFEKMLDEFLSRIREYDNDDD